MRFLIVYEYSSYFGKKFDVETFDAEDEEKAKVYANNWAEETRRQTCLHSFQLAKVIEKHSFNDIDLWREFRKVKP